MKPQQTPLFVMQNQAFYLNLFKSRKCLYSDYQLARHWHVEPSRISQYRKERLRLPLAFLIEIAFAIGAEPLEVIVSVEYHRARERDKPFLNDVYFTEAIKTIGARMGAQCASNSRYRRWR